MANSLLTTDLIADKALQILTEKLTFIPTINRDYDDSFARTGAKIGDHLRIRVPQHGTVRQGRIMQPDPLVDVTVPLAIANQSGIDLGYSSAELALDIDEIAERYLNQRVADLAISIESSLLSMAVLGTYSQTGAPDGPLNDIGYPLHAGKLLSDQLAPKGNRHMLLGTSGEAQVVKTLAGYFNSQEDIAEQYREGRMGYAIGFDWASSTVMPTFTSGSLAGTPTYQGAGAASNQILVGGFTASTAGVLNAGDIITIAGVYAVHAQTKQNLGYLRQFVVTQTVTSASSGNTTVTINPAIVTSGPQQNVSAAPATGAAIALVNTAGDTYDIGLAYTKDFFSFVTADLPLPPKKDSARRMFENISLRVIHDFDTRNDEFLARVDVMWGAAVIRPELAVRVAHSPALSP